jgi:TetR/AcrR family transcriptional repressor of nem operon
MATKTPVKLDSRTAMLEVGMDIMQEKGYTNTGIQEILTALSIPKGSFYHYFDSKENYAVEVIRHYEQKYTADFVKVLRNPKQTPLARLKTFCENGKAKISAQDCRKGCLIGNLSQEMSDQSEVLRQELSTIISKWRDMFAACIDEGQKTGEIKKRWAADVLAELFQSGWTGAMLRAKTLKNTKPLEVFINLMFNDVLKP